jgi:3-methyladenine DNA glycosylase/8-oxoguanine DNA glycosylase
MAEHTSEEIAAPRAFLAKQDRALAQAGKVTPPFERWVKEGGFFGLVQLVLEQQVSTASGPRSGSASKTTLTPSRQRPFSPGMRRICGRSDYRGYVRAVPEAVRSGTRDLDRLRGLGDKGSVANLVLIKGVARWTAEPISRV